MQPTPESEGDAKPDGARCDGSTLVGTGSCAATWRGAGAGVVIYIFLLSARGLLRAAAIARRNGHRRRRAQPAVAINGNLCRDACRRACIWRHGRALAAP